MRRTILSLTAAAALAAGASLVATGASAVPANGVAIGHASAAINLLDEVRHCRCVSRRWNGTCRTRICSGRHHWRPWRRW